MKKRRFSAPHNPFGTSGVTKHTVLLDRSCCHTGNRCAHLLREPTHILEDISHYTLPSLMDGEAMRAHTVSRRGVVLAGRPTQEGRWKSDAF